MLSLPRRAAAVTVVALMVFPLVFVQPAQAFDLANWRESLRTRSAALRVPGSTIVKTMPGGASSNGSTSIRRIAGAERNARAGAQGITLVPADAITSVQDATSPKKFAVKAAGAAGTAATAAWGVDLVYSAATSDTGQYVFKLAGLAAIDASSGNLMCDLKTLANQPCAPVPDPEYVPNSDVEATTAPGWAGPSVADLRLAHCRNTPTGGCTTGEVVTTPVHLEVVSAPAFNSTTGAPFEGRIAPSVTVPGTGWWNASLMVPGSTSASPNVRLVAVNQFNQVSGYQTVGFLGNGNPFQSGTVLPSIKFTTAAPPSGYRFDRIEYLNGSTLVATWYPPGHSLRPPEIPTNPVRTWVTTYRCTDGSQGSVTSDPWTEASPEFPAPPEPNCPNGLAYVKVVQLTQDVAGEHLLYEWTAPSGLDEFAQQYPECGNAACTLELHRLDTTTGTRLACFDNPEACTRWFDDPQRDALYVCTYGGTDVPLTECYGYAPTFDPARAASTGAPAYADPETGQTSTTTTPTNPAPSDCPPPFEFTAGGIGYWVTKGVTCALQAAFVPVRTPVMASQIATTLGTRAPVPEIRSIGTFLAPPQNTGSACWVLAVTFPEPIGQMKFLDSCDTSQPVVKFMREHRTVFTVAIWIAALSPLLWWVWLHYMPGSKGVA